MENRGGGIGVRRRMAEELGMVAVKKGRRINNEDGWRTGQEGIGAEIRKRGGGGRKDNLPIWMSDHKFRSY